MQIIEVKMKYTTVACVALIDTDSRILLARRPEGKIMAGLWEFPGGKLHHGETPQACLVRELKEELGIDTKESCLAPFTFVSHAYDNFHLTMLLFLCRRWEGVVQPMESQEFSWVRPMQLGQFPMPKANDHIIGMLRELL